MAAPADLPLTDTTVAILAGGLGTRLRPVLRDCPKLLAPVGDRVFLDWQLQWLARQGARRVVLCLGYLAGMVEAHLAEHPPPAGLQVETVVEPEPLGTGGALALAAPRLPGDPILVLNGDTLVEANLNEALRRHRRSGCEISLVAAWVDSATRYGALEIDDQDRLRCFREKDPTADRPGWINAGVILLGAAALARLVRLDRPCSLERELLAREPAGAILVHPCRGGFLDIGLPETLAAAPAFVAGYRWQPVGEALPAPPLAM